MSETQVTRTPSPNHILSALPGEEYERLAPHLQQVTMARGQVIYRPGETIEHVYFPLNSMVSMVANTQAGDSIEIGVVGREGMTGIPVVLGVDETPSELMVQLPDGAMRLPSAVLREEFRRGGALQQMLLRYTHGLMGMVAQTAACNRLHHVAERLARWLLLCHDRAASDELPLTHEFLAMMLGVRRAGVTEVAVALQAEGFISYKRGHITIVDRPGLEEYACECYGIVKAEFAHMNAGDTLTAAGP